jgi:hypothetical protein
MLWLGRRKTACLRTVYFWDKLYIATLRKHRLPVLKYLRLALDGHPFLPQGSKTA